MKIEIQNLAKFDDKKIENIIELFKQSQLKKNISLNTIRGQAQSIRKRIKLMRYVAERGGCKECGEKDFNLLEFDHRCQKTKLGNISKMVYNNGWEKIEKELKKCDIMCVKCHRLRTAKQLNFHTLIF